MASKLKGRFGVAGLVVALVGLLALAPAAAGAPRTLGGFVGGSGFVLGGEFAQPRGVAVSVSGAGAADPGDVYVVDSNNRRVQVLDRHGNFKFAFGRDVISPGAAGDLGDVLEVCSVAADCRSGSSGTNFEGNADGPGGEFAAPLGVVVDEATGDVFVLDSRENNRIQRFTAGGQFVAAWGWNVVAPGGPGDLGDAFEVCTVASVCQAGATTGGGAQAGQFGRPGGSIAATGVAISPTDGHVFAVDPVNRRVMEFDPGAAAAAGVFVRAFGWAVDGGATFETCTTASNCGVGTAGTANGQFANNHPLHIAVDADNVVYVSDNSSGGTANRVLRFDADLAPASGDATAALLAPVYPTTGSPTVGPLLNGVTQGLAVDSSTGNLLIARDPSSGNTVVQELTSPGMVPALSPDSPHVFASGTTQGLAYSPVTDLIYLSSTASSSGQGLFVLAESLAAPSGLVVEQPLAIGAETATLAGSLDPNGGTVSYQFEVSDTGAASDWQPVGSKRYLTGDGDTDVTADATGLQPNTSYRVRLAVTRQTALSASTTVMSSDAVFLTDSLAPQAVTLGTAERTDTTALLRAWVDPNGSDTTYRFEYGAAGGTLDHTIPVPDANAGSGNSQQLFVEKAAGLLPDTAYEYRVVAINAAGTSAGARVAFRTRAVPGPDVPVAGRAYELVSPADKVSGVGLGQWGAHPDSIGSTGVAAYDGERFAAQGTQGALLMGDAAQGYANDWAFADRIGDQAGWRSHSPFTHPEHGEALARFVNPHAASGDLGRVAWRTNNSTQTIFPELAAWPTDMKPTMLSDWQGRWEAFGPTDLAQVAGARSSPTDTALCEIAFSRDGSATVCGTDLSGAAGGIAILRGLGGPGDPTHPTWPDLVGGRSVYLADTAGQLADNLANTGARTLVNVCAGATELPTVDGAGNLTATVCPAPLPGRSARLVSDRGATLQPGDASTSRDVTGSLANVVSDGGSRVFFMSPDPKAAGVPDGVQTFCTTAGQTCPTQLFVRQRNPNGSVTTRWISKPEDSLLGSQDAALTGTVRFEGASVDGDKVFFRTNSPLTDDDPNATASAPVMVGQASNRSWDLYMYDLPDGPGADPADGQLTRLSGGPDGSDCNSPVGGGTSVSPNSASIGALRFVSDDGSRAYFTCAAPLDAVTDPPGSGTITAPGGTPESTDQANLYLYDTNQTGDQRWRFIARMPRATNAGIDSCATTGLDPRTPILPSEFVGFGSNCVRGSADGEFITFLTSGRLTADDPVAQSTADFYGYDAASDQLARISAVQGGVGGAYPCVATGPALCNADPGYDIAGGEAGQRVTNPLLGVATDPLVAGGRSAFFQSRSRLTADDVDAAMDVYEWRDGRLLLLTGGVDGGVDAFYKGNDRPGRNVYFATADSLTWQDHDAVADVYSARIGGGIIQPPPPAVCDVLTDSCQASGIDESVGKADSSVPGGVGNVSEGARRTLTVAGISRKARRRAARTGTVVVAVRATGVSSVDAVATARLGRRARVVARESMRVSGAGRATLRLRLSRAARRALRSRKALRVTLRVSAPGVKGRTTTVLLPGAKS